MILGALTEPRRTVDAAAAFRGYCSLDERAGVDREGYLSAFQFGNDYVVHLKEAGSVRGFDGYCWSPWLWFDFDCKDDLGAALADARRLASTTIERYRLDEDALLLFFSGAKGFHLGVPTSLWSAEPSRTFHTSARCFAEWICSVAGVSIDTAIYDRVRAFRAPNSWHPKTGLHKRRLTHEELMNLSLDGIRALATKPAPFEVPPSPPQNNQAKADWDAAVAAVRDKPEARRQASDEIRLTLNRATLDFIRNGAPEGERSRRLFSAAANLSEFGCPGSLAHALLTEAARDSGLPPTEVRRQINCGLAHAGPVAIADVMFSTASTGTTPPLDVLQKQLAELWRREPAASKETPPLIAAAKESLGAIVLADGQSNVLSLFSSADSSDSPAVRENETGPYTTKGDRR
ncbi:MAG: DNA primase [Planctomycetota bacterium]